MLRAEITVPIVLPTEKCVRVPLPDNYTFVLDDANPDADIVSLKEGQHGIAELTIHYWFDVGVRVGCDPDRTVALVEPSKFLYVPFYVVPMGQQAENVRPLGTGMYEGQVYVILTDK